MVFKQLNNAKLNKSVQEQVKLYILESKLKAGDVLPTEMELSEQIGVSRTSIREALRSLEALGIIESKHGVGRFLKAFDYDAILQNLAYNIQVHVRDFSEIIDVRIALENYFIEKVVAVLSDDNIDELGRIVAAMEKKIEAGCTDEELIENHTEFHLTLFKRSENDLLLHLIRVFSDVQYMLTIADQYHTSDMQEFIELHRQLLSALKAHDTQLVKQRLYDHYKDVNAWRSEHP
ncbi:MAG: FadR family transcriptional regulator [Spirochaetaceae bacterium]|nr:FadR family transcriptional regulator [Spirochaetaceae bacterium]MCF7949773.1 FadR family transcriptional regulator [Spirochaetia bacterium]MCF7952144.1 FadR family transcriptional regulator [Spirochaetaceae bacterium]